MLVLFAQGQENIRMKSFLFKAILCEINGIQIGFVQYSQLIYTEYAEFIYHSDKLYGRFEGDLLFLFAIQYLKSSVDVFESFDHGWTCKG